ncbi:hypothetical protein BGZ95_005920 [Linnemannia exigua]|uniref:Uncharacterized protein n=1 Tax=Linnemannia exigua TaxID=604196 RepID=A0AAD4D1F9_9FUNG|nr:hypothetical protein BGZ95_005920 [Linnemannia exigua]
MIGLQPCKYRYGTFHQDIVDAICKLPDLPPALPQSLDDETDALIYQLDYPTLTLLAKRNNEKLENFIRAQVSEKLPIEWIRPLMLLACNPSLHHAVALTLDPATDGLFVLGNNAVVASK